MSLEKSNFNDIGTHGVGKVEGKETDTLAFYDMESITVVKSFKILSKILSFRTEKAFQ